MSWLFLAREYTDITSTTSETDHSDHPSLLCARIYTDDFHWISGRIPFSCQEGSRPHVADIQIRHRMKPVKGKVQAIPGKRG